MTADPAASAVAGRSAPVAKTATQASRSGHLAMNNTIQSDMSVERDHKGIVFDLLAVRAGVRQGVAVQENHERLGEPYTPVLFAHL